MGLGLKYPKFSSIAEIYVGGSLKKGTSINIKQLNMPNEKSDIDLVIMLNKVPDKKNFDWMKSYVENLREMFKTDFKSSNVRSVYDTLRMM